MGFISSAGGEHGWLPVSGRLCVHTTHVRAPQRGRVVPPLYSFQWPLWKVDFFNWELMTFLSLLQFVILSSEMLSCSKKTKQHQSPPPQQKPLTLAYDGDIDM